MSIKVMSLVWDNFNKGGSEKLAMLALADWCNDQGGSLHPSMPTIAKKINVSESQARRIVHGFIDEGYLTVVGNHNGGNPGQSRNYQINIARLSTPSVDATPRTNATPVADATPSMDARLPLAPVRVTPSTHDTLTTNEPSIEPPVKKTRSKKSNGFELLTGIDQKLAEDFLSIRSAKKLPLTRTALDAIEREAATLGYSLEKAIKISCENSWAGFKAAWVKNIEAEQTKSTSIAAHLGMDNDTLTNLARLAKVDTYGLSKQSLITKINNKLGVQ